MSRPVFAKPPCIVRFCSQEDYFAFLKEYRIPYEEWGEENRKKAWKEVAEADAVYSIDDAFIPIPVRHIVVIVARVAIDHPQLGRLALTEFAREGHLYKPRRKESGSSLSEKALLDPHTGEPLETSAETIARCLWQETGMYVPLGELTEANLVFQPVESLRSSLKHVSASFGNGAWNVELDDGETRKFPKLPTFRQVARYILTLPASYYRKEGHQDAATNYFSFWRSVHERGSLEPMTVSQVRKMRKAPA